MIYSIIIILISSLSFLLFPVHSFYITNGAILEECSGSTMTYIDRFDPARMHCFNSAWQQTFIFLQYSCTQNALTRIWTIKPNTGKSTGWPQTISVMTGTGNTTRTIHTNCRNILFVEYTRFDKTYLSSELDIEENSKTFDPNYNQLMTYLWTDLTNGPCCRMKYTIAKDICGAKPQALGAKCSFLRYIQQNKLSRSFISVTELICYYGKQVLNLQKPDQQQFFDKLLEDGKRSGSGAMANVPSNNGNPNASYSIPNQSPLSPQGPSSNSNLAPTTGQKSSFLQQNKTFLSVAAIVFALIILAIIGLMIKRSPAKSSDRNTGDEISSEATGE